MDFLRLPQNYLLEMFRKNDPGAMLYVGGILCLIGFLIWLIWYFATLGKFTNPGKNELVFYHAGWCGYCKEFMPVFDATTPQLVAQFPGLTIVKYKDETDQEAVRKASPPIQGFPTIRLNGEEFEGPRTPDGLIAFVQTNYV